MRGAGLWLFVCTIFSSSRAVNFVLIFCDDLGTYDLGFNGHPSIKPPYLDQMSREGALFTDWLLLAYKSRQPSYPVCLFAHESLLLFVFVARNFFTSYFFLFRGC